MAGFIYECEGCVNRHRDSLRDAAEYIKEISDIDTASWDLLKIATALKMLCSPKEKIMELSWSPNSASANPCPFRSSPWFLTKTRVHASPWSKYDGQELKSELT